MKRLSLCGLLLLLSSIAAHGQAKLDLNFQQSPPKPALDGVKIVDHGQYDPRLKGYFAPEGLKIEIVAEAPDVVNPVGMTFDASGTLYVLEWIEVQPKDLKQNAKHFGMDTEIEVTYKDGSKRKMVIVRKPIKDRVKTLGYNAMKGVYDSSKVILEDELPSSILVHDGWVYLSGQGTVRRYRQSQPGGAYDKKEIIAQGFCGYHHHQVSGLTLGNDGWLTITSGDNDNFVEGADGSRATVMRSGAIFRCKPDGSKVYAHSLGYRNPYRDVTFDAAFNMFHADNDNEDGSKFTGCRLMHIPEGVDFGWRLRPGVNCCVPDHLRGAVYGELPGKVPPMLKTGRGAPAGLLIYNDTYFPPEYRGLLYYPDVFRKVIRAYKVAPRGATFEVTHEFELLRSHDPLFRPCQMVLGPDGAMYVCDWRTDSGGAGKLWGDTKHGRIYRLSWKGNAEQPAIALRGLDSWAKIAQQSDEKLFKTLESENFSDRLRAQQEIVRRGDKHRDALIKLLSDEAQPVRARIAALGALQSFWNNGARDALIGRLHDGSPDIRRLAADGLALNCSKGDNDAHEALVQRVNDDDLAVRRAVYLAIGRIHPDGAADVIVNGLQFDNGKDEYLTDGMLRALEYTGKNGIAKLLALADSGSEKDLAQVIYVYPHLRSREAAEQLHVLLGNYHVKPEEKVVLMRSYLYCQVEPPISLEPLVKFLDKLPALPSKQVTQSQLNAMKLAALDVLASSGKITSDKLKTTLLAMLKTDDPKSRQALLQTIAEARLTLAVPVLLEHLAAAKEDALKLALVRTLGQLSDRAAFEPLKALIKAKDPALRIEVLRALSNIDNRPARKVAESLLADDDVQVQREAVVLLGQSVEGARLLGQQFVAKKLPRTLLPEVSEALRHFTKEHPDLNELLSRVVKGGLLVSLEPQELARVSELVRVKGDPIRGRNLYLNNKAVACISCHRLEGIGGNVGPDLTRMWDTLSLEKVMESMLDPSREIKEGYQSYVAVKKNGQVVSGLKVAQNDKELILKDATGKEVRIPAADLEEVAASKKSLMPDDVVRHLSFNEFIDLVAFLRDRKAQEELRGMVLSAWVLGPLDFDFTKSYPFEKNADPQIAYETPEKTRLSWKPIQADMGGKGFDLRPMLADAPGSVFLLSYVYSPKEQKVSLQHQTEEKLQLWLNGKSVEAQAGMTPLTLQGGWNVLLLRINNEAQHMHLQARLLGGEGIRISLAKD